MYRHWPTAAQDAIREATKHLPADATLAERKKALHGAGPDFHGGTSHGKKIWGRECRAYYERHGQAPRKLSQDDGKQKPKGIAERLASGDISFPFSKDA